MTISTPALAATEAIALIMSRAELVARTLGGEEILVLTLKPAETDALLAIGAELEDAEESDAPEDDDPDFGIDDVGRDEQIDEITQYASDLMFASRVFEPRPIAIAGKRRTLRGAIRMVRKAKRRAAQ